VLRKRSDSTTCFVKSQSHQHPYFKGFGGFFFDFAAKVRLAEQIQPLKDVLDAMGLYRMEMEGFEADDLIGTLARLAESDGITNTIVSGDKDVLQLVSDKTRVFITKKGISQMDEYNPQKLEEEYGIPVAHFIDLKGLMGDSSDNIPGIPGVGPKTATKLLQSFGTIEKVLENTAAITNRKLREKIEAHREDAVLSKKLATIMTHVPVEVDFNELLIGELNTDEAVRLFRLYEFNSLLERITDYYSRDAQARKEGMAWQEITGEQQLAEVEEYIKQYRRLTWHTLSEKEETGLQHIVALAFSCDGERGWWMDCRQLAAEDAMVKKCCQWLADPETDKVVHDIKQEQRIWMGWQGKLLGKAFDIMIADYLVNPSKSSYALEDLSIHHFGEKITSLKELWGNGRKRVQSDELDEEAISEALYGRIRLIHQLRPKLEKEIHDLEMDRLMNEVEMPLADVLAEMEMEGIRIDIPLLKEFEADYETRITAIREKIEEIAGHYFNLNSPKQLGEVLFEDLRLTPLKKTKTGYSTDVEVLEKLKDEHEIVPLILEYRQMSKIKGTYIDGLLAIVNPDTGRIHSTFNQTVAATGRISSTEPNLQNIPVRTEMGRQLRRVFIARESWKLIDADYSQIELRIMAHLSGDPAFMKAFQEEADIHTRTAAEIFQVPESEVTLEMRGSAKAVNFGIIYGISDFGLANNLNISRQQARQYIDHYLDRYGNVKKYMDEMVNTAREKGYVTTLLHRIRHLPEINSSNYNVRSFGERMAMNTPIQGSAADIIKIAMVRVADELRKGGYQARLILQVHDELIVEAPQAEVEAVSRLLRKAMEEAVDLSVPIKVDLSVADNWFDAK
jgi:DNA polymerase I